MHRAKQGWQWMRSLVAKMSQQTHSTIEVASLLKNVTPGQADHLIRPLAILIGAAAFGVWRQSLAAALFAGVGLFLLAGIYSNTERTLAVLGRSEIEPRSGEADGCVGIIENNGALNQAIISLKPWLANEVSLTEEDAKERCAVLLDSVARRERPTTGDF